MATILSPASPAAAKPGEAPASAENETKNSGKKWQRFLIAAVVLSAAGGVSWAIFFKEGERAPTTATLKPDVKKPPVLLALEPFIVNLSESGQFLQITLDLQVEGAEDAALVKLHMSQVRNRMLLLLSSMTSAEIIPVEGKIKLAEVIKTKLRQPYSSGLPEIKILNVYFTTFVIQ